MRGGFARDDEPVSIFEHALPGSNGRWLADDDGVPICTGHLRKACPDCDPPGTEPGVVGARLGSGEPAATRLGSGEPAAIPRGQLLGPAPGEPIASRRLSADGMWLMDLNGGNRCCVTHLRRVCTQGCPPMPAGELVAAAGGWAKLDTAAWTEDDEYEPGPGYIPKVDRPEQLTAAIGYAMANPHARWYIRKRAVALGFADAIPRSWRRDDSGAMNVAPESKVAAAADDEPARLDPAEREAIRDRLFARCRPLTDREKLRHRVHHPGSLLLR